MPDLDQIKQGEQASARPARGRSLKPPTIEDAVKVGGFLAGQEDIIEALKAVEKRYPGLDRVICATPLEVQLEDLDRFAKGVIPAFRGTRTAAAAQETRGSTAWRVIRPDGRQRSVSALAGPRS